MPFFVSTRLVNRKNGTCLKETNVVVLTHVEVNIPHNGNKGVMNYIMGSCAIVAMNTT
jgi:hypothetical protein